jgi:hypothetical protein
VSDEIFSVAWQFSGLFLVLMAEGGNSMPLGLAGVEEAHRMPVEVISLAFPLLLQ